MFIKEIFESEQPDVLQERTNLVFTKRGDSIVKHYRCASGRVVRSPGGCPSKSNLLKKNKKKLSARTLKKWSEHKFFNKLRSRTSIKKILGRK